MGRGNPVYPMTLCVIGMGAALLSRSAIAQQPDATKFNPGYDSTVGVPKIAESVKKPAVPTTRLDHSVQQPEMSKEPKAASQGIRRSEFKEWTIFDIGGQRILHYMRLSSIEQFDDKVAVQWKFSPDTSVMQRHATSPRMPGRV
jgi:hypothetical protein